MNRLAHCIEVLSVEKGQLHLREIARLLVARYPAVYGGLDLEGLAKKVGQSISNHIRNAKRKALISRVTNGKGGHLSGVYKAKQKRQRTVPAKLPEVSNLYTGKAGEYGLLSELLFRGYNASIMTVDEGIDVVASKGNKYFHIQVKTANRNKHNKFQFTIQEKSYKSNNASTTFYALITRRHFLGTWRSDYIVFQSGDIARLIAENAVTRGKQYSFLVRYEGDRCLLNSGKDITYHLNNFEPLK